jgi:S-adenosylmethionine uptake transporter
MSRAVLLVVVADGVLSFMDVLIKQLTARHSPLVIAFLRFGFGFVVAAAVFGIVRPGWPSREQVVANSVRSAVIAATAVLFFYALQALPLADCAALSFLAPMFIALFGALLLGERLTGRSWGSPACW